MKIISYLDNDQINRPATGSLPVYALDITTAINKEQLIKQHPRVFGPGIGLLEGKYHICIDDTYKPVQHAPRCVPVAIRDKLKQTLEHLAQQGIITPVTESTDWISSMVAVTKKNGTLRICLDPKDLNHAIRREHYPLPTIEDVASRLYGAKLFTILDVKMVSGMSLWTNNHHSSPHFTCHLDNIDGTGCPLVSVQHRRFFSEGCTN